MLCPECRKEVSKDWAICPYCSRSLIVSSAPLVTAVDESTTVSDKDSHDEGTELLRSTAKTKRGFWPRNIGLVGFGVLFWLFVNPGEFGGTSTDYGVDYAYGSIVFFATMIIEGILNRTDPRKCVNCGDIHEPGRLCGAWKSAYFRRWVKCDCIVYERKGSERQENAFASSDKS